MIILVAFLLLSAIQLSTGKMCNGTAFDANIAKLLSFGESGRMLPEDKHGQLKTYCEETVAYIKDIEKYKNKCMKDEAKRLTGLMVYDIRRVVINKYCKRISNALTDLIASTPCPNRAKKEWDYCYTQFIDNAMGISNARESKRLPHVCCEYHRFFDCIRVKTEKNKNCTEAQIDTMINFIKEMFQSGMDSLCGDYNAVSDRCEKLGPPPKMDKGQQRAKSIFVPVIAAIGSLSEA